MSMFGSRIESINMFPLNLAEMSLNSSQNARIDLMIERAFQTHKKYANERHAFK